MRGGRTGSRGVQTPHVQHRHHRLRPRPGRLKREALRPCLKPDPLFSKWMLAIRPRTLPAALAPVAVGAAVAQTEAAFRLLPDSGGAGGGPPAAGGRQPGQRLLRFQERGGHGRTPRPHPGDPVRPDRPGRRAGRHGGHPGGRRPARVLPGRPGRLARRADRGRLGGRGPGIQRRPLSPGLARAGGPVRLHLLRPRGRDRHPLCAGPGLFLAGPGHVPAARLTDHGHPGGQQPARHRHRRAPPASAPWP
jgi:hypothetical protein